MRRTTLAALLHAAASRLPSSSAFETHPPLSRIAVYPHLSTFTTSSLPTPRDRAAASTARCLVGRPNDVASTRRIEERESSDNDNNLGDVRRIFAISDLHTDSAINMQWLTDRCTTSGRDAANATPGPNDALIIAGDISHDLDILRESLSTIVDNLGCHVFFIPGNHEAWIGGQKMDGMGILDSFDKLQRVEGVCKDLGIHTTPKLVGSGSNGARAAWIVPIWSWYDGTLALPGCEDLCDGFGTWPWVDFTRCEWGEKYRGMMPSDDSSRTGNTGIGIDSRYQISGFERIPRGLAEEFASWNVPSIDKVRESIDNWEDASNLPGLITYSHFLPSKRTLPDWKVPSSDVFQRDEWLDHPVPEVSAKFAYVAGSQSIDDQIRSITPSQSVLTSTSTPDTSTDSQQLPRHIHVFGHSHRPKDFCYGGIRYVHNPVGKPVEREMNMISNELDFQLIWDSSSYIGEVPSGETVIRYWEQWGGGVKLLSENMAKRRRSRRNRKMEADLARKI
eukprot:CAMPEP_0178499288 /NCGR_PEP_ID=MMETSP0696-20121128/15744_1 /TAXON_ID=265572 /ORGANISM="Extubocellulus spinifer, Strain CCMP396" /LENGTH=505 /DNA_ID=CAMNT_0020127975 /DNA_START=152 /DNA_END=1669 /DNA_ORIENTATION=+